MKDLFEKETPKPARQPLSFNQTAFAVMLGMLLAQELRGALVMLFHAFFG